MILVSSSSSWYNKEGGIWPSAKRGRFKSMPDEEGVVRRECPGRIKQKLEHKRAEKTCLRI
jgi:hypothetical protein